MTMAKTPMTMAPPTPTTTPMMIFLSEAETPLLELLLLSPLSEGEDVSVGIEVEVMTWGTVLPLTVWYEVMVSTTGVWVVDEESDVTELSSLEVLVGSLFLDEVVFEVWSAVFSTEVVDLDEEEEEEVVGSAEVVVGSSWEEEDEEEVEEEEELLVVGSAEVAGSDDELESLVTEGTRSVTATD